MAHKFKIGDEVVAIDQSNGWGSIKGGDVGTISYVSDDGRGYKADFRRQDGWAGDEHCFKLKSEVSSVPLKLYEFDKDRALSGEPVYTRSGKKVTGKVSLREGSDSVAEWCLVAESLNVSEPYFREDGSFNVRKGERSAHDLMMLYPSTEAWKEATNPATAETQTETQEVKNKMATAPKATTKAAILIEKNKAAAITAAKIEAGQIAVNRITKMIQPKLPIMLRGYADTSVARIVVANLFSMAAQQYAPGNQKAILIADAMMEGAMLEFVKSFNIDDMLEQVIKGVDFTKLSQSVEE